MTDDPARRPETVRRAVDRDALELVARLLRENAHACLATLEAGTGHPLASRTAFACDHDGAPIVLVSALAAHTIALRGDPRCSLLIGEPGSGDPLAHPRLTLIARARCLARDQAEGIGARERYLSRHPKAKLYADFGDFSFWRLEPERANLNGGFGRAWTLQDTDLRQAAALL